MSINKTLFERFRGETVSGEWLMSEFKDCGDPGYFYISKVRVIGSITGHPDKMTIEPLELKYRPEFRPEDKDIDRIWRMPDGKSVRLCNYAQKSKLSTEKENAIYEAIRVYEPNSYGFDLSEKSLKFFIGMFAKHHFMFFEERFMLSGIMKGDKNAVKLISDRYTWSGEEMRQMTRQMTRSVFNTNQSRTDVCIIKPEGFKYKLNSN